MAAAGNNIPVAKPKEKKEDEGASEKETEYSKSDMSMNAITASLPQKKKAPGKPNILAAIGVRQPTVRPPSPPANPAAPNQPLISAERMAEIRAQCPPAEGAGRGGGGGGRVQLIGLPQPTGAGYEPINDTVMGDIDPTMPQPRQPKPEDKK